jgi:hypothetical protein
MTSFRRLPPVWFWLVVVLLVAVILVVLLTVKSFPAPT